MNQELYCIEHESMTHVEETPCVMGHIVIYPDVDYCCYDMGWAFVEPPVFDSVEREPYQEELEAAEQGAQEFLLQLTNLEEA